MKLIANCKNCRSEIRVKNSANDRVELAKERGFEFLLTCKDCSKKNKYHVNDIKAKVNKVIALIAFLILVPGTGIMIYLLSDYLFRPNPFNIIVFGGVLLVPSAVYAILTKQERDNTKRFNQYRT